MKSTDDKSERRRRLVCICLALILLFLLASILMLLFHRALWKYPHATFTYSPITPLAGETITFDASASYDPDGIIVDYTWNFGDGGVTSSATPTITHIYMTTGNYAVTLVVTDNDYLTDSAINIIKVGKAGEYPIAHFTYSPDKPFVGDLVNFDASSSTPNGGQILLYEWDFGDGKKVSATDPITTHVYTRSGTYQAVLSITDSEKLTDTTSKLVKIMRSVMIDLYSQHPYPYGGQGLNCPSDAFAPQDYVMLSANVTFKGKPLENKLVTFEICDPTETPVIRETATTSSNGIAGTRFTIPWQPERLATEIFGTWSAYASAEVIGEKVNDTLTFQVNWLVELVGLETCDYAGNIKTSFGHEEKIWFKVCVKNIAMTEKNAIITIAVHDELDVPIGLVTSSRFVVPPHSVMFLVLDLEIPKWAFVGNAAAYANAFTDLPSSGGIAYCPQISAMFFIILEAPTPPTPPTPPEGWLVELIGLETCDYAGNIKTSFAKGENVYFKVLIKSDASVVKNVTVSIVVLDELGVPIGQLMLTDFVVPPHSVMFLVLDLEIPKWAFVGNAAAYANAFTDLPSSGGIAYCPQISATFGIHES